MMAPQHKLPLLLLLLLGVSAPAPASAAAAATHGHHPPGVGHHRHGGYSAWLARHAARVSANVARHQSALLAAGTAPPTTAPGAGGTVIVVDQKGGGNFATVQAAVDSVKPNQKRTARILIKINAGTYREKVVIPKNKPFLTLQGAGREVTKITWHDTAASTGTTIKSATVAISAPNLIATDITFENSAPLAGTGSQAVALKISGDKAAFFRCGFLGAQDTLYDHAGRHYYKDCFIQGAVDFIFGDALSLYQSCTLNVIQRAGSSAGSLTAQKRGSGAEDTGYSFVDCRVVGSDRMKVYLGRAWGAYSRVVFARTFLADVVTPAGWYNWGVPARQSTVFYGQYRCTGPGANAAGRVTWAKELTDAEAAPFLSTAFVDGQEWVVPS